MHWHWAFYVFIIYLSFSWLILVCVTWKGRDWKALRGRTSHTLGTRDRQSFTASFSIKHGGVTISHHYCRIKLQHSLSVRENTNEERRNARLRILYLVWREGPGQGLWCHPRFSPSHHAIHYPTTCSASTQETLKESKKTPKSHPTSCLSKANSHHCSFSKDNNSSLPENGFDLWKSCDC